MDYYENAQIGGYRFDMPFPQLFYPELSGGNRIYQQTLSQESSARLPSSLNWSSYEGSCKQEMENPHDCNRISRRRRPVTNSAFAYRSMERQQRLSREMQARNGLHLPGDHCHKQIDYPQYAGDSNGQSNSYWQ